MTPAQAMDTLAHVESVRADVRGRRAPAWFLVMAALIVGLCQAAAAAAQEHSPISLLAPALLVCLLCLFFWMNARVTGAKVAFFSRPRKAKVRRVGAAFGVIAVSNAAGWLCRLAGGGDTLRIVVPSAVGAVACWGVLVLRNRSVPANTRGSHAR